ncbi:MAG: aminoglycoside phosphotransferase family protein [Actinobacteria bacterium]|nr:aminoglycoside phosphotransferase family protein [Actinomycetota bacterium]
MNAAAASCATDLSPDPVVASRDTLLDAASCADLLSTFTLDGATVDACVQRRVKYRIAESLRVVYDVSVGGRSLVMSARTFADSEAVYSAITPTAPVGSMPGVAHDAATSSVWWTLPNDRRMRNLGILLDAPARVRDTSGVDWARAELVEYAPERSATARVVDATGRTTGYAKAYRDRDPLELTESYNRVEAALAGVTGVRTPRVVGCSPADRIIVLEPMPGISWTDLDASEMHAAMSRFGAAIAHAHGLPTEHGRGPFGRYPISRVRNSADLVATARPDLAAAAGRIRDLLGDGPPVTGPSVSLHGDVHSNNVLFDGDVVAMIDFDQGGAGPAAADLGSLLSTLLASKVLHPERAVDGLGTAFLDGYASVRELPDPDEMRWYTAAAFVAERAIRAVNRVYRPTLAVLPELLDLAADVLVGEVPTDV